MQQLDGRPATTADLQALALVGLGHFTTLHADEGRTRGLGRHLERLARDARRLFDHELDAALVRERIRAAIADEPPQVIVRVTVFDPALSLTRPGARARPEILVSPRAAAPGPPTPLRLRSVRFVRELPELKHTGLFGALLQRREAQRAGFDDAVFAGPDGRLAEGPTWNLGFVRGDRVVWPDGPALPGVTRALVASVAGAASTEPVRAADLPAMDAAFATASGFGIRPIAEIDGTRWRTDHPALARLSAAYREIRLEAI